jgi:hypothetical protein
VDDSQVLEKEILLKLALNTNLMVLSLSPDIKENVSRNKNHTGFM